MGDALGPDAMFPKEEEPRRYYKILNKCRCFRINATYVQMVVETLIVWGMMYNRKRCEKTCYNTSFNKTIQHYKVQNFLQYKDPNHHELHL